MGNLDIWNKFADIDPQFTKPITGKAYRGTSPSPQYVIRCLTELFGPVGKGFGWSVVREEFTPLGDEILHWCRIQFWWADASGRHEVEQYGQTKALMKTKSGLMSDEDAPKKSLTDAIVKAASHIGVAANIFLGRWDDQKYVAEVNKEYRQAEKEEAATEAKDATPEPKPAAQEPGAVATLISAINSARDMDELTDIWKGHAKSQAAADERAINAKDAKKAEFARKAKADYAGPDRFPGDVAQRPTPFVSDDQIPF